MNFGSMRKSISWHTLVITGLAMAVAMVVLGQRAFTATPASRNSSAVNASHSGRRPSSSPP